MTISIKQDIEKMYNKVYSNFQIQALKDMMLFVFNEMGIKKKKDFKDLLVNMEFIDMIKKT